MFDLDTINNLKIVAVKLSNIWWLRKINHAVLDDQGLDIYSLNSSLYICSFEQEVCVCVRINGHVTCIDEYIYMI